jgi:hypothetical protein
MNLIPIPPPLVQPSAKKAAESLLEHINAELRRRVEYHSQRYAEFWDSADLPDDILAEMGTNARTFYAAAGENIESIGRIAALVGLTANDFISPEQYAPRREVIIAEDGSATLAPPDEGFDAWGRPIPEPEPEPEEVEEVEVEPSEDEQTEENA